MHLVRYSLRYAANQHWQAITREMKHIYTAPTLDAAEEPFAESWQERYPPMIAMWQRSWPEFIPFLDFPVEVRKLIYTTNAIAQRQAPCRASAIVISRPRAFIDLNRQPAEHARSSATGRTASIPLLTPQPRSSRALR